MSESSFVCDRIYLMKLAKNICEIPFYKTSFDESWADDIIGIINVGDIIIELYKTSNERFCMTKMGVGYISSLPDFFEYLDAQK